MNQTKKKLNKRRSGILAALLVFALIAPFAPSLFSGKTASALPAPEGQSGFKSDYATRQQVRTEAQKINQDAMTEGAVLLKNEGGFLPLDGPAPKVTVFGKTSVQPIYSGTGSSSQGSADVVYVDTYAGLKAAGFDVNPTMEAFYRNDALSGGGRLGFIGTFSYTNNTLTGFPIGETRATGSLTYSDWNSTTTAPSAADLAYDPATSPSNYASVRGSYAEYNDTAIIVLGRVGGENYDLARTMRMTTGSLTSSGSYNPGSTAGNPNSGYGTATRMVPGARSMDDHYLQLDLNETNMIKEAAAHFDNIVILYNGAMALEAGFLDDPTHYAYSSKIKSAVWIGTVGENGYLSVGKLLRGEHNPSGGLVDIFTRNFKNDPVWQNYSKHNNTYTGNMYSVDGVDQSAFFFVEYQEGIYMGYRYYETRFETEAAGGADWYKDNVVYPFGHGLSYSTFDWTVVGSRMDGASFTSGATLAVQGDSVFEIDVNVKNTGTRAGKDTVEIYATAPYTAGGIEKSSKVLVGFAKTPLLNPQAEAVVTVKVQAYHFASFDVYDKNTNLFYGYELEAGAYKLNLSTDSHNVKAVVNFNIALGITIDKDPTTDTTVGILFPENNAHMLTKSAILSRNGNFSNMNTLSNGSTRRNVSAEFMYRLGFNAARSGTVGSGNDAAGSSSANHDWLAPSGVSGAAALPYQFAAQMERLFYDVGAPIIHTSYDDVYGRHPAVRKTYDETTYKFFDMHNWDFDDPRWDVAISELTWPQIAELIGSVSYGSARIDSIGKPQVNYHDGPVGWTSNEMGTMQIGTLKMVSTCIVAATFNVELARDFGRLIGEEGVWGYYELTSNARVGGSAFSGWYAPGANIHRSPFSGRNFEYFSEDAYLSGKTMAAIALGAQEKGVYSFMKHFFLNDQETNRSIGEGSSGLVTWADEQTMREVYARAFEIAVKELSEQNDALVGIMCGYNRVGYTWVSGNYAASTGLLRDEWGFKGNVITDMTPSVYTQSDRAVLGGFSKILNSNGRPVVWGNSAVDSVDWTQDGPVLGKIGSATRPAEWPAGFAPNFVPNAPLGNTYKYALHRAAKHILYADSHSNAFNTAAGVSAIAVNITTGNQNANGVGKTFTVGSAVNYSLATDTAANYRPYVNHGDRSAPVFKYALADGYKLPAGLTLRADGRIVGVPTEPTLNAGGSSAANIIQVKIYADGYLEGSQAVTLRVNGSAIPSSSAAFRDDSFVGIAPFEQAFSVNIGAGASEDVIYTYALAAGNALPAGLTLYGNGMIGGTPAQQNADVYSFTVVATALSIADNTTETFTKTFTIQIGTIAGPTGPAGADGKSAYELWKEIAGNESKTIEEFFASLKGETGTAGADGKSAYELWKGIAGNESKTIDEFFASLIGTPGADGKGIASIAKTGTNGNVDTYTITYSDSTTSTFTVTNGADGADGTDGADGKSAYELWKEIAGNGSKTIDEFFASLKGETGAAGADGTDGKSAYELWKEIPGNGSKTIDEFFASLIGTPGANGKGIASITKTGTSGNVDTYTITYSDSTTSTFTVTNGADGKSAYELWKEIAGNESKTEAEFFASLKGLTGDSGGPGAPGTDGATWYSGTSAPGAAQGKEGDFYLNTTTWDVYKKGASGWGTAIGNIKGATGETGATGPAGSGCSSSSAAIVALFSLLACAFVVVIKKQF